MNYIFEIKKYIFTFFTKGHERSIEAKKNIVASFLIKGVSIAISLILVPLTIHYVNPTKYGIWITLSSIIGWFSFFDIGFGNGLRNKFAEAKAIGDYNKAKIYVSTTYAILILIFSAVLLIFFFLNYFISWSHLLNAPPAMANELSLLAMIIFSFFCIQIVLKIINTILIADQKPAKAAFFDMIGQLMALLIIFILTRISKGSLLYLGVTYSVAPIVILIISSFWFFKNKYQNVAPSFKSIKFYYAKDLMNLGLKFFIIQIAGMVIYETSNIIISNTSNPTNVTVFNIAFKYFGVATMAISIILAPYWSAFTDAKIKNDYSWMQISYFKLKKIWGISTLLVLVMLIISNYIYKFWIGDAISIPYNVSIFMAINVILLTWIYIHGQLLNGLGKIKLQLYFAIFGLIFNIPLSFYLANKYGIIGVIMASIAINGISAIWAPRQINLLLSSRAKGVWNE